MGSSSVSAERLNPGKAQALQTKLIAGGVVLLLGALGLGWSDPRTLANAWLLAFMVGFTTCAGAMFWYLLHHAVDARWSIVTRRLLENIAALFPWLALAFVPFFVPDVAKLVWKWMKLAPGEDFLLDHKSAYLNKPFFYARAAFYLLFFCGIALWFRKKSLAQDADASPYHTLNMRKVSYGAIPLFALSLTFASFDWLMGLDHHWFSTMWGVYIFSGSAMSGMAALILLVQWLQSRGHLRDVVTVEHRHIMGKFLFAFTVFWAYIAYCQYMLYYYANIPEETTFFIYRNEGQWRAVSIALVWGHFILPFLVLLSQTTKRHPLVLSGVAVWMILMHVVDLYWIIKPAMQVALTKQTTGVLATTGVAIPALVDVLCVVGMLLLLAGLCVRITAKAGLFAHRDPHLQESLHLKN